MMVRAFALQRVDKRSWPLRPPSASAASAWIYNHCATHHQRRAKCAGSIRDAIIATITDRESADRCASTLHLREHLAMLVRHLLERARRARPLYHQPRRPSSSAAWRCAKARMQRPALLWCNRYLGMTLTHDPWRYRRCRSPAHGRGSKHALGVELDFGHGRVSVGTHAIANRRILFAYAPEFPTHGINPPPLRLQRVQRHVVDDIEARLQSIRSSGGTCHRHVQRSGKER